jgi:hypothetical protein
MPNGAQYMDSSNQFYDEEYGEEEQLDEDGLPVPSPDEIKNIINAIPSFKFEEKKKSSSQKDDANSKESCAICLDDLQTGQMVKALACSHKFHSSCINFWLKQKLKCPLCKERISLNNFS